MKTLNTLTLKQTLDGLAKKTFSLGDLYRDLNAAVAKQNKALNIYLTTNPHAEKDAIVNKNLPLAGIPLAVKDNFLTVGLRTTASSKVLDNFMPPYESTVTHRLKNAGAVIYGKTNMDAWSHGSSTKTSDYGPTKNPRNPEHFPGGSSGGNAAALSADMCIAAIGSETAGSIRQPSSWCGTVGLKPTYGRVSRAGVVAMGSSLDSPGPMGKTVEDTAILLGYIAGKDPYDGTTSPQKPPLFIKALGKSIKNMKIGVVYLDHPYLKDTEVASAIEKTAKVLESLGAVITHIPLSATLKPNTILTPDYAVGVYTVVQRGEVSSNLARYDGIRYGNPRSFFSEEARKRIMLGTFTLSKGYSDKYYVMAQKVRSLYIENYHQLFEKFDVLISTTSPRYAEKIGSIQDNPLYGELEDLVIEPSSISGLPGISVPCHHDKNTNLYLGLNIISAPWQEEKVIQVAHAYEQNTDWNSWVGNKDGGPRA